MKISASEEWSNWRKGNLLSHSRFAQALGVSLRTVYGVQSGKYEPSELSRLKFEKLKQLCRRKSDREAVLDLPKSIRRL